MALRQNIPDVPLGNGLFPIDMRRVKKFRPPITAKFRFGGDLREVLEAIRANQSVAVVAGAGAGKSIRLPGEIATLLDTLVIQVVPNEFLAWDLSEYVKTLGVDCVFREDPRAEWPESGVVIVSAAGLVAYWLALGAIHLPPCVLYHDEVHESDAYTCFLKKNALEIPGVQKYVTATATPGAVDFRPVESGGHVEQKKYDCEHISSEWDLAGEQGLPWEFGSINDNVLIYEDDKKNAQRMVTEYNMFGFETYRLHARMKLEQFKRAMIMSRAQQEIVVLIADSTFRSGFTMSVATVIDTAVVSMFTVDSGVTIYAKRDAYLLECYQAASRVGRVPGTRSVTWLPKVKLENKIVLLEDTDADAVVLLHRAFGRLCPIEYIDSPMAEGKVPRDLVGALRGFAALSTLHDNFLVDSRMMADESGRRSPMVKPGVQLAKGDTMDFLNPSVSADVARKYVRTENNGFERRDRSDSGCDVGVIQESKVAVTEQSSLGDVMGAMMAAAVVVDVAIEQGGYYCAPAIPVGAADFSPMFPEGYISVLRMFAADEVRTLHYGLAPRDRWIAINALLVRLNTLSCELNGALSVARDVSLLAKDRDPVAVREWVGTFMSRIGEMQADSQVLIDCLMRLTHRFCEIQSISHEFMHEQEARFAEHIVGAIRVLPLRGRSLTDVHSRVRDMMLEDIPGPKQESHLLRLTDGHVDRGPTVLGRVPMPKIGRGMRGTSVRMRAESNSMRLARWFVT